jgi:hypothetical protein
MQAITTQAPYQYIKHLAKYYPRSVWPYILLWENSDEEKKVLISKSDIKNKFLMKPDIFYDLLLPIVSEALISIGACKKDGENFFSIELTGWEDAKE